MSIKIYNGKKIIHNESDFSEMFNYIKNTKKDLEKIMRKDFLEEYSKVAIRFKVEQDINNRNSIWFNIRFEEYEKENMYFNTYVNKSVESSKNTMSVHFYNYVNSLTFFPLNKNETLLIPFISYNKYYDMFSEKFSEISKMEIIEYCYYDNTDEPEDLTEEDWKKREEDWNKVLLSESSCPANEGLSVDFNLFKITNTYFTDEEYIIINNNLKNEEFIRKVFETIKTRKDFISFCKEKNKEDKENLNKLIEGDKYFKVFSLSEQREIDVKKEYEKINKELSLEYFKNFDFDFLKGFKLII